MKREKSNPSPNPSPEKGDYADMRKSSIGGERDDGDAGGLGAGGGSTPSFAGFVETLKGNVESPETMEAARSMLEQAAVAHLEVLFYLCSLPFVFLMFGFVCFVRFVFFSFYVFSHLVVFFLFFVLFHVDVVMFVLFWF